ncbi:YqzL family protein [Paenibacillus zeisoli]|uniref:YqzL family protein n=1 Tax=Paenibacillus zeisoli TaxID=2496267 RepID=A0A433XQN9_9BACL|nr:YqzL family protein [Paenibacillus zeisoli]RUT36422.1 YqzL family protein [Paenibacillus zeisoli]
MRDFSWNYFSNSGDVDAYLLYKAATVHAEQEPEVVDELILEEEAN